VDVNERLLDPLGEKSLTLACRALIKDSVETVVFDVGAIVRRIR